MTGPIPKANKLGHPKRAADREEPTHQKTVTKQVKPPDTNPDWHPIARGWFNSLKLSPLCPDYRETDWTMALVGASLLDDGLYGHWTAATLHEFGRISERLCMCIGDRRRARIEIIRSGAAEEDDLAAITDIHEWQQKLLSPVPNNEGNDAS